MRRIKYKAFTIIELLVVLVIIGIFSAIAYPNVSSWITDREVKKEVNTVITYIKDKKSEVESGKYGVVMISFRATPATWLMSNEEYFIQMKNNPPSRTNRGQAAKYSYQSIMRNGGGCPGSPGNYAPTQYWTQSSDALKWGNNVRHWPNFSLCISKNAKLNPAMMFTNPVTNKRGSHLIICSASNTSQSGSNRCNINNKVEYRYMLWTDRSLNITIYKWNKKKNNWILQK